MKKYLKDVFSDSGKLLIKAEQVVDVVAVVEAGDIPCSSIIESLFNAPKGSYRHKQLTAPCKQKRIFLRKNDGRGIQFYDSHSKYLVDIEDANDPEEKESIEVVPSTSHTPDDIEFAENQVWTTANGYTFTILGLSNITKQIQLGHHYAGGVYPGNRLSYKEVSSYIRCHQGKILRSR